MSGRPGSSRTSRRKRKPRRCSRLRIRISGFVLRPRMPDIIRLRVAASTTSTMLIRPDVCAKVRSGRGGGFGGGWCAAAGGFRGGFRCGLCFAQRYRFLNRFLARLRRVLAGRRFREQRVEMRHHRARHFAHHRHHHAVAELAIRLRVAHGNAERVGKAHQARALARRQAARTQAFALMHEDLAAVLVIARRQRARHALRKREAVAEAVTGCAMLLGVLLEIGPETGRERVLRLHAARGVIEETLAVPRQNRFAAVGAMQDRGEARAVFGQAERVPRKIGRLAKSGDDDALAMLRREMAAVDHAVMHVVAEFVTQDLKNYVEGAALVVRQQVLDVLQQKGGRPLFGDDARHVEKERALRGALETVRTAERVLLRDARDRKRLARKAREQHVVVGHVGGLERGDIADEGVAFGIGLAVVLEIGLLRERIPLARHHAAAAVRLEAHADPADAREQIDETKARRRGAGARRGALNGFGAAQQFAQRGFEHGGARRFAFFPPAHGLDVLADVGGDLLLREALTCLRKQVSRLGRVHEVLSGYFGGHYDRWSTRGTRISGHDQTDVRAPRPRSGGEKRQGAVKRREKRRNEAERRRSVARGLSDDLPGGCGSGCLGVQFVEIELDQQTVDLGELAFVDVPGIEQPMQTRAPVHDGEDGAAEIARERKRHDAPNMRNVLVDEIRHQVAGREGTCRVHVRRLRQFRP
ncbi:hypothetical protein PT2222_90176 [Paraburkholderia tropica]